MQKPYSILSVAIALAWLLLPAYRSTAQNLNTPNKTGPMGLQVNTFTGNLFFVRTDVVLPGRAFPLIAAFAYNSFDFERNNGVGKGWTFRYHMRYLLRPDTCILVWGDGREDSYAKTGSQFTPPPGFFSTLQEYQTGKMLLTDKDGTRYFFDDATHRRLTRIQEPNGNSLTLSYTDTLLTGIGNSSGQSLSLAYNSNGWLSSVTDAMAIPTRSWSYQYDGGGNLTRATDPLGNSYHYSYLANGPLREITDRNGNVVNIIYYNDYAVSELIGCNRRISFTYNEAAKTSTVTEHMESGEDQVTKYQFTKKNNNTWLTGIEGNCCGFKMRFEYDDAGNKIKETDANGNTTAYTYDEQGNVLTLTNALGQTWRYTYTPDFNNISTATEPGGNTTRMSYDASGNLLTLTDAANRSYTATYAPNGDLLSSTDPKGNTYTYVYDGLGNPIEVNGPHGYKALMAFDNRGRLLSYTDSKNQQSQAEYDILNRLQKLTDPLNQSFRMQYDANGNLVQTTNAAGETMRMNYDASNRPVVLQDALRQTSSLQYDEQDNVVHMRNVLNQAIQLAYDKQNRLHKATNALGEEASFEYDNNGNLTEVQLPNGRRLRYVHDALDRLVKMEDNHGALGEMSYDENGNLVSITNATGATVTAAYDALNRPIRLTDALGNSVQLAYDANGRIGQTTDRIGNTNRYEYDGRNRLVKITDQIGAAITISYDANGNVSSLTDQQGNITSYQYDALNRVTRTTYADGKFMTFSYDKKSNLISSRLTDGSNVLYTYDTLNRMVAKTLPDGRTFTYTYDALGRVLTATNDAGAVSFGYDNLNRVVSESFKGRTVQYSYNTAGRTQTTTYPDGTIVTMQYDSRNRLTRLLENNQLVADYAYNAANQILSKTLANGISSQYQYDAANRLVGYSSGPMQQVQISYDKQGNKTEVLRLHAPHLSERFTYDSKYRMTGYQRGPSGSPNQQHSYSYDALGNRLSATINGVVTTYSSNNLNQLTQTQTGTSIRPLLYDENGNLRFDGLFHKTYDAEKRLLKDSASPSAVYTYQYDAVGRRVGKTLNGQSYEYSFAGIQPIVEYVGGQPLSKQVYSGFLSPLSIQYQQQRYYYLQNELGSVENIINTNGRLVERYEYDPFGRQARFDSLNQPLAGSLVRNRIGFTGQEYDSATSSNAFYFRNYNPELGIFQQRDLIGYADGMGLYQYVHNNPANGLDLLGLNDCNEKNTLNPNLETISTLENWLSWINAIAGSYEMNLASKFGELENLANHFDEMVELSHKAKDELNALSKVSQRVKNLIAIRDTYINAGNWDAAFETAAKADNLLMKVGGFDGLAKAMNNAKNSINQLDGALGSMKNAMGKLSALKSLGFKLNVLDVGIKMTKLGNTLMNGQSQLTDKGMATADLAQSFTAFTPPGALYNLIDFFQSKVTGKSFNQHLSDGSNKIFEAHYQGKVDKANEEYIEYLMSVGKYDDYIKAQKKINNLNPKPKCPQNSNGGGTSKPSPYPSDPQKARVQILGAYDPNEIIGPVGQPTRRWVSVNDRLPYTVNFENDTSATAPAKAVRISVPIHTNLDAAKFELGSFGFNSLSFTIPPGTAAYYQRLDCLDSLGLFVDITAGYDVQNKQAFWLLQSIDPLTLQTPTDPLKGLLLLQDSTNPSYGHGFVNFSIKPRETAQTRDTVMEDAVIVFDENDPIATNKETNTIDAVAPTSQLNPLPPTSPTSISLRWSGSDDPGGSGLRFYSLYVSEDGTNFNLLRSGITRTDTVLQGKPGSQYFYFVLATDTVGNTEKLRPGSIQSTLITSSLPVTWLRFNGERKNNDAILNWSTGSEQNSQHFIVERSVNGIQFKPIGKVKAAGFSIRVSDYTYTDAGIHNLQAEYIYYRLKQVDKDGSFSYSNIIRITGDKPIIAKTVVYPNPTQGMAILSLSNPNLLGTQASIFDQNGRLMQTVRISSQQQAIDLSGYVNGLYYIKMQNKEVLRVLKQR